MQQMAEYYSAVTDKAKRALERDGGFIHPFEEGQVTTYRVEFPAGSESVGNGEIKLPSGAILGWDGNVEVDDGKSYPLYLKRSAKLGRPKMIEGDYDTISVAIRKDLLAKMDANSPSRREQIEMALEKFLV